MESFTQRVETETVTKEERFAEILQLILQSSPATSATEAIKLCSRCFHQIETKYQIPERKMMKVNGPYACRMLHTESTELMFQGHYKHYLFLGMNGAIEIREKKSKTEPNDEEIISNPSIIQKMKVILEKPGADGKSVWE